MGQTFLHVRSEMAGTVKKGKRTHTAKGGGKSSSTVPKKAKLMNKDEELSEEGNDEEDRKQLDEIEDDESDADEIDGETVDETRLRLAKEYLKVEPLDLSCHLEIFASLFAERISQSSERHRGRSLSARRPGWRPTTTTATRTTATPSRTACSRRWRRREAGTTAPSPPPSPRAAPPPSPPPASSAATSSPSPRSRSPATTRCSTRRPRLMPFVMYYDVVYYASCYALRCCAPRCHLFRAP